MKFATEFVIIVFMISCTTQPQIVKTEQQQFEAVILDIRDRVEKSPNDIASEEILKSALDSINSTKISIKNWSGLIKNVYQKTILKDSVEFTMVEFLILSKHERCEISYVANYIIRTDSLASDSIYNSILKFGNLDRVIFSGEIDEPVSISLYNIYYPEFNFKPKKLWSQKQ